MSLAVAQTGLIEELAVRRIMGVEEDWKVWEEAHKTFQADLDEMDVIRLDPNRDSRVSPISEDPVAAFFRWCRSLSWYLLMTVRS
ncbi:hypothetical protein Bca52824_023528 [Brassica carinata]|uniref:Uncharacterized protein n=1 Tax=Brassica carinata TaxID=52824 RepID=A0A8X7VIM9_BRACI|nr:hypothetical protein Bca52824_023528 [Brassica carinata]